jgi:hypothetical protein
MAPRLGCHASCQPHPVNRKEGDATPRRQAPPVPTGSKFGAWGPDVDLAASKASRSLMPRKEEQVFSVAQSAFLRLFYRLLDFPWAYRCKPLDLRLQGLESPRPCDPRNQSASSVSARKCVNLRAGKIVDATIRAIIPQTDGLRLQVDFGFEQTALIHAWQVVDD